MPALAIPYDISPEELRRQARHVRDGRVSVRMRAIATAMAGLDRATGAPGGDGSADPARLGAPLIDTFCDAWNWLIAETGRIRSLCSYLWLKQVKIYSKSPIGLKKVVVPAKAETQEKMTEIPGFLLARE